MIKIKYKIETDLLESDKPLISLAITHLFPDEVRGEITVNAVNEEELEAGRFIFNELFKPLFEYHISQLITDLHIPDFTLTQRVSEGKTLPEAIDDMVGPLSKEKLIQLRKKAEKIEGLFEITGDFTKALKLYVPTVKLYSETDGKENDGDQNAE